MVHQEKTSYPTGDVMMNLDPWRSPGVVEVVEEAHEASCLMKKLLKKSLKLFDPHLMAYGPRTLNEDDGSLMTLYGLDILWMPFRLIKRPREAF